MLGAWGRYVGMELPINLAPELDPLLPPPPIGGGAGVPLWSSSWYGVWYGVR
jgi:hypothetical protein